MEKGNGGELLLLLFCSLSDFSGRKGWKSCGPCGFGGFTDSGMGTPVVSGNAINKGLQCGDETVMGMAVVGVPVEVSGNDDGPRGVEGGEPAVPEERGEGISRLTRSSSDSSNCLASFLSPSSSWPHKTRRASSCVDVFAVVIVVVVSVVVASPFMLTIMIMTMSKQS